MLTVQELNRSIEEQAADGGVQRVWDRLGEQFEQVRAGLPREHTMQRGELSFHDHVRLLGYLCALLGDVPGDLVEIGVWKGRSLALMSEVGRGRRVVGIDPFELPRQFEEFGHYQSALLPDAEIIHGYSELSAEHFYALAPRVALLHIDGGHTKRNVLLDFLLYAPAVAPGGFVVFDDYADWEYSPEVGPAVDLLRAGGLFADFHVVGCAHGFENSYVLQRR